MRNTVAGVGSGFHALLLLTQGDLSYARKTQNEAPRRTFPASPPIHLSSICARNTPLTIRYIVAITEAVKQLSGGLHRLDEVGIFVTPSARSSVRPTTTSRGFCPHGFAL